MEYLKISDFCEVNINEYSGKDNEIILICDGINYGNVYTNEIIKKNNDIIENTKYVSIINNEKDIDTMYIYLFLRARYNELCKLINGSIDNNRIMKEYIYNIDIPMHDYNDQQLIIQMYYEYIKILTNYFDAVDEIYKNSPESDELNELKKTAKYEVHEYIMKKCKNLFMRYN